VSRWSWAVLGLGVIVVAAAGVVNARGGAPPPAGPRLVVVGGAVSETVFALGAGELVVGVDTSSVYPPAETARRAKVGYQRLLSAEGVLSLRPTQLLVGAEAGPPAALAAIRAAGVPIVEIDAPYTLEGARERVRLVAAALGRPQEGEALVARMLAEERRAADVVAAGCGRPRVLFVYARGVGSPMVSGDGTPADAMIELAGGQNAVEGFAHFKPLTAEAALAAAPDVVLVPARALAALGGPEGVLAMPGLALTPAGRAGRVAAVDDLLLLGFGPRAGLAVEELSRQLRPCLPSDAATRDGEER
jgi:iron complex transport system substrate-binding protein